MSDTDIDDDAPAGGERSPRPTADVPARRPATPSDRDPLHGVTLEAIVQALVEHYGWEDLGRRVRIKSFNVDPSVASSLKFLRRTPWAREQVESLYRFMLREWRRSEAGR